MLHLSTLDTGTYQLLRDLFTIDFIKENFALAGGTALALQIGHRQSIDLDLFSTRVFNVKELEIILAESEKFRFEYTGSNSRMLFGFINQVKCDFVNEPAVLINPFLLLDDVAYFSIADIAAMKLHAICGRGKKKDFIDIYALLQLYSWGKLLEWFTEKYGVSQLYYLQRSILYFEDAEEDPDPISFAPFTKNWKEMKEFIINTCS